MKQSGPLLHRIVMTAGSLLLACQVTKAEVACPSNWFPSPTGIYRNETAANVIYGATLQIAAESCQLADRSAPPPKDSSPSNYVCCMTTHFRVISGGSTTPVFATVPVDMTLRLTPSAMGTPGVFDLEVLAFTATGLPAGIMIRESPTLLSTGQHTIRQVPSGNYYISSFFDVFTEVSSDGGMSWTPGNAAMHFNLTEPEMIVSTENQLPPARAVMKVPGKIEYPNLVQVDDLQLKPSPASITSLPLNGTLYQTLDEGKATGKVSLDGGTTFASFECNYKATRKMMGAPKIGEATFYTTELVALDLSGGTLPAGLKIRESPTKASLGRASSRPAADGLYRISSFFDIFTECSLNHGATWTASEESVHAQYNPKEVGLDKRVMAASSASPPLKGYFGNGDIPDQEDLVEYPDGTIIRRFGFSMLSDKITPPALGAPPVDASLTCRVSMEVSRDGGLSFEPLVLPAATTLRVNAVAVGAGASASIYDVEVLALNVSGTLASGTPFMLRESPTSASTGRTTVQPTPEGRFLIGCFFDIFTELSLDSGASWSAARKNRCYESQKDSEVISADAVYPPPGAVLDCDDGDDIHGPEGIVLRRVKVHSIHNGSNLPPPLSSKTFSFTTSASGELSTDGGATFRTWIGECAGSIHLTSLLDDGSARYFDTELLALDLSGGGLGTVRLRESPTKASLGRTSVRTTPASSFGTLCLLDVFTEISADNGSTWTPSIGLPVSFGFATPSREYLMPTVSVPLAGVMESRDDAFYSNGVVMKPKRNKHYRRVLLQQGRYALGGQSQDVSFGLEMEMDVSLDGGATFSPVQTIATCEATISESAPDGGHDIVPTRFDCEFVVGSTTVKVRESPSLPSSGRIRKHIYKQVGTKFDLDSQFVSQFFDIFTEISLDGGIIWSPQSNRLHLDWQPVIEQDNAFAASFFPPRDGSFDSEPGAPPVIYSSSAVINNLRVRINELEARPQLPPSTSTPVTQSVPVIIEGDLSLDGGATWSSVSGAASCGLHVTRLASDPTQPIDLDITVEGLSTTLGTVMVRESPTKASTGRTTISTKTAGLNANGNLIDSFFDIFTEISLDGGATWLPAEESCSLFLHRQTTGVFDPSKWQPLEATHRAMDPDFEIGFEGVEATISGLTLDRPISIQPDGTGPPPAPGATLKRQCLFNLGLKGRTSSAAAPESQRMKVEVGWSCTRDDAADSTATVLHTEITSFDIVGGELTGGMRLRESPTRASTGRTTISDAPGGYVVRSFFDIFTEISLDGGQTWHEALTPLKMETVDASRPKRFGIGGSDPLPPLFKTPRSILKTYFETGDKPQQAQFASLIDSMLNFVDDRQLIGLREYDATIDYQTGDTGVVRRDRTQLSFGYVLWTDPKLTADRTTYDMDITQFDMSGGTMPAGLKLRESPTLPSRGRCERVTHPDGSVSVMSFFDVFTEISHDNGATWSASDLPLHFEAQDNVFSSLTHSDQFIPQGIYKQTSTPVRCVDGTCADTQCSFTSPPAPLPTSPGVAHIYPHITGHLTSSLTRAGAGSTTVSSDVDMDVSLTLDETVGSTRSFDVEVLKFQLTGTISPAEFRLRESPTKASLGRHIVTDVGGGDFRITGFFDVFTEISLDGGSTWSECDVPLRLELGGPELDVQLEPSIELTAGSSSIDFGYMLTGSTATRNILISNHGNIMLSDFGMSRIGANATDFGFTSPSSTTLAPGETTKVPITFTAGASGTRTATLHITSNDSDESPFDITLTARALAPNADDDGDGLTNQQEMNIQNNPLYTPTKGPGLNPLHGDSDRLALFRDNGLFLASDVQALNMDVPLLQKLPGTNQFKLIFGLQKSTDLIHFDPFPLSAPQSTINAEGKLEFLFTVPDSASFFRVQSP